MLNKIIFVIILVCVIISCKPIIKSKEVNLQDKISEAKTIVAYYYPFDANLYMDMSIASLKEGNTLKNNITNSFTIYRIKNTLKNLKKTTIRKLSSDYRCLIILQNNTEKNIEIAIPKHRDYLLIDNETYSYSSELLLNVLESIITNELIYPKQ